MQMVEIADFFYVIPCTYVCKKHRFVWFIELSLPFIRGLDGKGQGHK